MPTDPHHAETTEPTVPTLGAEGAPVQLVSSRRTVLRSAGVVALAGCGLAALPGCSADSTSSAAPTTVGPASSSPSAAPSASPSAAVSASATPSASASVPTGPEVAAADVPVGGGVFLPDANYVVTQPAKGSYKAFSKICTHQNCPVTAIEGGSINCQCHGSKFSIEDGSVQNGPATKPLPEAEVTVAGDAVVVTA